MTQRTNGLGRTDVARCWAGFASLGAGLVHVTMIQEHLDPWLLAGVVFGVLAVPGETPRVRQLRTGRALGALAVGALVMAGLTTPALASSEAGEHARPHFGH